jgi:predicted transcriptional regulator
MKPPRPSDLELQILTVLWERGPLSVRAVRESLPDGKDRAYTSVLSVMQVMEKKGLLGHTVQGHANLYHPLVNRQEILRPIMRELLRNVFRGSPAEALQCLLDSSRPDAEELSEIQQVIQQAARKARRKGDEP